MRSLLTKKLTINSIVIENEISVVVLDYLAILLLLFFFFFETHQLLGFK